MPDPAPVTTSVRDQEDTDFICRRAEAKKRGLYEATPGVVVYQHDMAGNLGNVTTRTKVLERTRSMPLVSERYPARAARLGKSCLRHCAALW
ncbi:hypothetical protein EEB11_08100 [Pseudotabrizicola sediminis]|uniref:Uncharacterized protein n=1 Tax=Pseudotabrizicola sediminis TaxID=2486418 RepID=A0ABY2KRP1_9RHOB|nr:hypothetical protein EEB11_08100 [Pseudotabrizicola sediminis]